MKKIIKRTISIFLANVMIISIMSFGSIICEATVSPRINKSSISLAIGSTYELYIDHATESITWSSENENIATVKKGIVTAKANGKTTIVALHGSTTLKCNVDVTSCKLSVKNTTMHTGDTQSLKLIGADSTIEIKWSSSDKKVLGVTKNGKVTARTKGTAKIYAKYDGVKYSKTINVTGDSPSYAGTYNNHVYAIYDTFYSWDKAKEYCESLGGHLATITSSKEQSYIEELNSSSNRLWIGGHRKSNDYNKWHWITNEKWNYTNWGSGEPNNQGNEDCLAIWPKYWNDLKNSSYEQNGFVCEWDY